VSGDLGEVSTKLTLNAGFAGCFVSWKLYVVVSQQ
jgi:hypothetical protein